MGVQPIRPRRQSTVSPHIETPALENAYAAPESMATAVPVDRMFPTKAPPGTNSLMVIVEEAVAQLLGELLVVALTPFALMNGHGPTLIVVFSRTRVPPEFHTRPRESCQSKPNGLKPGSCAAGLQLAFDEEPGRVAQACWKSRATTRFKMEGFAGWTQKPSEMS